VPEWKGVPGWRAYQVSTDAQARSVDRLVGGKMTITGRRSSRFIKGMMLTPVPRADGTPCVNLWRGNRYVQVPIRRLMMLAFKGPRPRGMDAENIDGDVTNNDLSNLRWAYSRKTITFKRLIGMS
jgi:hypothetical protein